MSGELPEGWILAKVKEAGDVQLGRQRSPKYHSGENMRPYLRVANVFEDRIDISDVMEMDFNESDFRTFRLNHGDILLNEGQSRELVGRPAMFRDEVEDCCFTNSLVRFRAGPATSSEFSLRLFLHYLKSGDFMAVSKWTTNIAHLGAGRFAEMDFPLPPLNEQKRIVARIDALTEKSREAREALDEVPALLDKLRQSILAAAFRGDLTKKWREKNPDVEPANVLLDRIRQERRNKWEETELAKFKAKGKVPKDDKWKTKYVEPAPVDTEGLPELPEGWCWANFGSLFEVKVGATPSRKKAEYWGGDVPWVSSGEVAFCRIGTTRETISEEGLRKSSTSVCPKGTVLLGMIGEGKTRGQAAILDIPASTNQNIAALLVSETQIDPSLVYRFLQYTYQSTRNVGSGNNQPALNKSRVQAMMIPLPPVAEQLELLAEVERLLRKQEILGLGLSGCQGLTDQLDASVLAKAFRGELVPQDPNDEPASVLLERIRKKPEGATAQKKVSKKKS